MEKVSFGKGDSGNWAMDYKPSNIINPDIAKPVVQAEDPKVVVKVEPTEPNKETAVEKELLSDAERKKREAELMQKLQEERLAQQKLMQMFYAEKVRVDMSPDRLRDTMKALAERSIEQLMVRDGSSMKVEWKSELHKVSVEISENAYEKLNEYTDLKRGFAEAIQV